MPNLKTLVALVAPLALLAAQPLPAEASEQPGAVFAMMDRNEWCPGGSVYVDLQTGSFMLYPRLPRPACADPQAPISVEQGKLAEPALRILRSADAEARSAGLRRKDCDIVVSNGGPEALVITGPAFSAATPEERGCWSIQAVTLYNKLFQLFGGERTRRK